MGSWMKCMCGGLIHTNMFSGTSIYQLIKDADYDALEDPVDRDKLSDLFFRKGVTVYRCHSCGRLLVEWDDEGVPTFYLPEGKIAEIPEREAAALQGVQTCNDGPVEAEIAGEPEQPEGDQPDDPRLKELEALAEAAYDEMYDSRYPTGCYSRAKEAFYDAIGLAARLGRQKDVERLERRLQHVKDVFRSQFT
jgi:hypothetical protein